MFTTQPQKGSEERGGNRQMQIDCFAFSIKFIHCETVFDDSEIVQNKKKTRENSKERQIFCYG